MIKPTVGRVVNFIPAVAIAFALAGCNSAVSNINAVTGALTSPQAQQAVANLKAGSQDFICVVNGLAAAYDQIAVAVDEGKAAIKDANNIYTVSSVLCKSLGGTVTGTGVVGS